MIRPRPALIAHLTESHPQVNADDVKFLQQPRVVMTEEVPFERDLEGWRPAIKNKCKEAFLRQTLEWHPFSLLQLPEGVLINMDTLTTFFDQWWEAEEAEDIEIEAGSWKTRECCPLPPDAPDHA